MAHKDRNVYGHTTIVYCEIDGEPENISAEEQSIHELFFADEEVVYDQLKPKNIQYLWRQYLVWRGKSNSLSDKFPKTN